MHALLRGAAAAAGRRRAAAALVHGRGRVRRRRRAHRSTGPGVPGRDLQPRQPAQRRQHPPARRARSPTPTARCGPDAPAPRLRDRHRRGVLRRRATTTRRCASRRSPRRARLLGWRPRAARSTRCCRGSSPTTSRATRDAPRARVARGGRRPAARAMKLVVVVPAYNAARHLPGVVARILAASACPASSASSSSTTAAATTPTRVARALAATTPALASSCVRPRNGGYGAAMKDGLERARAARRRPGGLRPRRRPVQPRGAGRALARARRARTRSAAGLAHRRRAGALRAACRSTSTPATGCSTSSNGASSSLPLTDFHSGYLVYGPRALAELPFSRLGDSFDFDLEVIAAARARGLAVGEAPIPTHYGDEISHLNPIDLRPARAARAVAFQARRYSA